MIQHVDDLDSLRLRTHGGVYEAFESAWLRKVLKPWSVFVDVGAHIGYYSALAADALDGAGRVYAFEPCPANFDLLQKNTAIYGNMIKAFGMAVGEKVCQGELFLCNTNSGDHRLAPVADRQAIPVCVTTLDASLADVPAVDLLKIDVQGSELQVLRGAREIIGRSPKIRGIIEYSPELLTLAGEKLTDFFDIFEAYGLRLYMRREKSIIPADVPWLLTYHRHLNLFFSKGVGK
jgi:FkbM family methyltransferase